ncbi:uncharacterized protein LOC101858390 [Aplysia californica]|uniref:Uncharacterized protein LOC101858390 n=1 Tax=Aplysia californica TaxID=6500 RepID=A0ABM0ZV32_APLCA|nr:uncharacterized protein LOC101858390 [Aplysia californica]
MKVISVILATCLALAAAHSQKKRQDAPPAVTNPPAMMTTDMVNGTDMMGGNDSTTAPTMAPVTTPPPAPPAVNTSKPTDTTTMSTSAPVTNAPMPTKIVSVEEIVEVFEAVSKTDYFKRLSYEDQLLVMEILSGGETGKMTPILEQIGFEHLLNFMYELPLKYVDDFNTFVNQGFVREHSME